MAKMSMTDNGGFAAMIQILHDIEENIPKIVREVHREGLNEAEDIMHGTVHVISGDLDRSIIQTNVTDTHGEIHALAHYAGVEEYRGGNHSFFRPGVEHYKSVVPDVVKERIANYMKGKAGSAKLGQHR